MSVRILYTYFKYFIRSARRPVRAVGRDGNGGFIARPDRIQNGVLIDLLSVITAGKFFSVIIIADPPAEEIVSVFTRKFRKIIENSVDRLDGRIVFVDPLAEIERRPIDAEFGVDRNELCINRRIGGNDFRVEIKGRDARRFFIPTDKRTVGARGVGCGTGRLLSVYYGLIRHRRAAVNVELYG